MDPTLLRILAYLLVVVLTSAGLLIAYSWLRTHRVAFDDFRRAAYLATLGDVATRAGYPAPLVRGWARDRVFRAALVEFLTFLTGTERDNLIRAAHELEIVDHYRHDLAKGRRRRRRVAAAEALGDLADAAAIPDLLAALSDRIPEIRVQCAHALASIGDPLTVTPILDRLAGERERWVAERLADALRRFDAAAVLDTSIRLEQLDMRGEVPSWSILAARVLGAIGDIRAERSLLHCLVAQNHRLREAAAAGLGRAGTPDAVAALLDTAYDPHPSVRRAAVEALGRHLDPAALETLEDLLHDPVGAVRIAAASSLTKIPGGTDTLVEAVRMGDVAARDAAADALMEAGIYRQATVRIKTRAGTHRDHELVDALDAMGRVAIIPDDPFQRAAS
jgi:HEAT repeat protein